jgi:putative ABC transport system permease protein
MHYLKMIKESFLFAGNSVIVNRLRALLSLLGITIGIFAIISVLTVLNSMERSIQSNISSLGDDVVYIQKWPWTFGPDYPWWEYMKRPVPSFREYEELNRRVQGASAMAFSVSASRTIHYRNNAIDDAIIWANSYEFQDIRHFEITRGRYFSFFEAKTGKNVVIIGARIAEELLEGLNPIGKEIKIGGTRVRVIGVIEKEGKNIFGGGSLDDVVLLPINFARGLFDIRSESLNPMIMVKSLPGIPIQLLIDELRGATRSIRRLKPAEDDNFALNKASIISQGFDQVFVAINLAGWIIGGFSILVGGFGIANIMFVSVKERTNIIGIEKALGAKNYFILLQFLFESLLLALTGGILGLVLVFLLTFLGGNFVPFDISMSMGNILTGIFVSSFIGIVSGFAPAYSAARLNPVEAINTTF